MFACFMFYIYKEARKCVRKYNVVGQGNIFFRIFSFICSFNHLALKKNPEN